MSPDPALSFEQLAEIRRELVQDVRPHRDSVNFFASAQGFRHTAHEVREHAAAHDPQPAEAVPGQPGAQADEPGGPAADAAADDGEEPPGPPAVPPVEDLDGAPAKGITTAYTCFESLNEAILDETSSDPAEFAGLSIDDRARLDQFTANALADIQGPEAWRSEKSARRYCIVRAIPPLIRLTPGRDNRDAETALIREVWGRVGLQPGNCGVFEVAPKGEPAVDHVDPAQADNPDPGPDGDEQAKEPVPYPPNAFLTYWALKAVRELRLATPDDINARASINLWLRAVVGRELALHNAASRVADPQQLAWAIAGLVSESETPLADHSDGTAALIEAGLSAFFDQQSTNGTWDTGRPLFHYLSAGNAYCYVYETLAELLALALDPKLPASPELRRVLLDHLPSLVRARAHLMSTSRPLGDPKEGLIGWSSGHHPHRTSPESWATATAFRFLQGLRRLVGLEVREQAEQLLQARRPKHDDETLALRGRTWDPGNGEAGHILSVGLVAPIASNNLAAGAYLDPDLPRIPDKSPRSAILYGPPGTGKTTLAESVAGALGWNFVEVTSADFLSAGSDQVSARADEIFRQLMELDQVVILFDEVDELIRRRSGPGEMAGRFFTTTMLPRLSRLWDGGRTVFFLNTNGIHHVDPAVRRSQRFDAAILVLPPSYQTKVEMLPTEAKAHFDKARVDSLLEDYLDKPGDFTDAEADEAWFAFLRYDQLKLLKDDPDRAEFFKQLVEAGEELPADWELALESNGDTDLDTDVARLNFVIRSYQAEKKHQRLDTTFRHRLDLAAQQ